MLEASSGQLGGMDTCNIHRNNTHLVERATFLARQQLKSPRTSLQMTSWGAKQQRCSGPVQRCWSAGHPTQKGEFHCASDCRWLMGEAFSRSKHLLKGVGSLPAPNSRWQGFFQCFISLQMG